MTAPRPAAYCSRCGAEVCSALPLCTACGAGLSTPLEATALRPEGFGAVAAAPLPGALAPAALSASPPEPAAAPPPTAAPPTGTPRRRRRAPPAVPEEKVIVEYGLSTLAALGGAPAPALRAPAFVPPAGPTAPYPPAVEYPPAQPATHAPSGYVVVPAARGGSAAKPGEPARKVSALAVVGFILAFACFPLGLVVSLVAFARIKASKGKLRGEWLAVVGVIVAVFMIIVWSMASEKKSKKPRRAAVTLTLPAA